MVVQECMDMVRPGVHWDMIHLMAHRVLVRGFQRLGIFKNANSAGSGSWNSEEAILASGVSAAFFPHGLGHSIGMDVHDVPSASKPANNKTVVRAVELGHKSLYNNLRLRLPLEQGMVVVRCVVLCYRFHRLIFRTDCRARRLLPFPSHAAHPRLQAH